MTAIPESHRDLLDAEFATLATVSVDLGNPYRYLEVCGRSEIVDDPEKIHAVDMTS